MARLPETRFPEVQRIAAVAVQPGIRDHWHADITLVLAGDARFVVGLDFRHANLAAMADGMRRVADELDLMRRGVEKAEQAA